MSRLVRTDTYGNRIHDLIYNVIKYGNGKTMNVYYTGKYIYSDMKDKRRFVGVSIDYLSIFGDCELFEIGKTKFEELEKLHRLEISAAAKEIGIECDDEDFKLFFLSDEQPDWFYDSDYDPRENW